MKPADAVCHRIMELCEEKDYTIHRLSIKSAMKQSTLRDFMNSKNSNIGIITINKICDGLDLTLQLSNESRHIKG